MDDFLQQYNLKLSKMSLPSIRSLSPLLAAFDEKARLFIIFIRTTQIRLNGESWQLGLHIQNQLFSVGV